MHLERLLGRRWGAHRVVELHVVANIPAPIGFVERWDWGTSIYATDEIWLCGEALPCPNRSQHLQPIQLLLSTAATQSGSGPMQWVFGIRADLMPALRFGARWYI